MHGVLNVDYDTCRFFSTQKLNHLQGHDSYPSHDHEVNDNLEIHDRFLTNFAIFISMLSCGPDPMNNF